MIKTFIGATVILLFFLYPRHTFSAYFLTDANYEQIVKIEPCNTALNSMNKLNKEINNQNFMDQAKVHQKNIEKFFTELKCATKNIINKEDIWYLFKIPKVREFFVNYCLYYHQRNKSLTDCLIENINSFFDDIFDEAARKHTKILALISLRKAPSHMIDYIVILYEAKSKIVSFNVPENKQYKNNTLPWFNIIPTEYDIKFNKKVTENFFERYFTSRSDKAPRSSRPITFYESYKIDEEMTELNYEHEDQVLEIYYEHEDEDGPLKELAKKRGLHIFTDNITSDCFSPENKPIVDNSRVVEVEDPIISINLNNMSQQNSFQNGLSQQIKKESENTKSLSNTTPPSALNKQSNIQPPIPINAVSPTFSHIPTKPTTSKNSFLMHIPKSVKIGVPVTVLSFLLFCIYIKTHKKYVFTLL